MDRNHPVNQSYRSMRIINRAYESRREAGFSTLCISTTLIIFLAVILIIPLFFI